MNHDKKDVKKLKVLTIYVKELDHFIKNSKLRT